MAFDGRLCSAGSRPGRGGETVNFVRALNSRAPQSGISRADGARLERALAFVLARPGPARGIASRTEGPPLSITQVAPLLAGLGRPASRQPRPSHAVRGRLKINVPILGLLYWCWQPRLSGLPRRASSVGRSN